MKTPFEVQYVVTDQRDLVVESAACYEFRVIDSRSGQLLMSFCGEDRGSCSGWCSSGVVNCKLDEELGLVLTIDSEGRVREYSLPTILH